MSIKYKRLLNRTDHKHEPQNSFASYALRCSSKLQVIQSLENFVSKAIQGTQVSMYTKHTLFLCFFDFSKFCFLIFTRNKIKQKLKTNKQKHVKQNIA